MNVERKLIKLRSPISLNLETTSNCNWKCEFCSIATKSNNHENSYRSLEKFKSIIDELTKAEVLRINLFGGEPFLHPEITEIAKYAKDSGFFVGFTSNGSRINEKMVDRLLDYVIGGSISIHGLKDTHEKITGVKHSFEKSVKALEIMTHAGLETGICYTLTNRNKDELEAYCDYFFNKFKTIKYLGVNRFIPQGRGFKNREKLELSITDFNDTLSTIHKMKQKYNREIKITDGFPLCLIENKEYHSIIKTCSAGISFGAIDEYGNIKFCSSSPYIVDNILETPLEEIWQNSKILENYRSLDWVDKGCKECYNFERCMTGCRATRQGEFFSPDIYLTKK